MKKVITLSFIILISISVNAQVWQWAKNSGGTKDDEVHGCVTDASGNVYIAGDFSSPSLKFGSTTLTNPGPPSFSIYLVKYDPSGNVLWAKSAGGYSTYHEVGSIALDDSGHVFMIGTFFNSITFGSYTFYSSTYPGTFVVKYDGSGNVIWAVSPSTTSSGQWITVHPSGNIFIASYFGYNSAYFGSITLNNSNTDGSKDIIVAKLNSIGKTVWAKKIGGTLNEYATSITVDDSSNVYLSGYFESYTLSFGSVSLSRNIYVTPNGFIAKYDSSGTIQWAKKQDGRLDYGSQITHDGSGNIYAVGTFLNDSVIFNPITIKNINGCGFFVKYNSTGNVIWAKGFPGRTSVAQVVQIDYSNNLYIGGYYMDSINLGGIKLNSPRYHFFVAKFDSSCNALGAVDGGYSYYGSGMTSMALGAPGDFYLAGQFGDTLIFGSTTLLNPYTSWSEFFVAKLSGFVGIDEPFASNENPFIIYPNPSTNKFTISFSKAISNTSLKIFNMMGEEVYAFAVGSSKQEIETGNLAEGIYFVKVRDEERQWVEKIVISH